MSKELGLIFTDSMVRSILSGNKWQTRRPLATKPPKADVGDWIWVREAWTTVDPIWDGDKAGAFEIAFLCESQDELYYRADGERDRMWRPSIHMPKFAARIWLPLLRVWKDPVQKITEEDAIAEGLVEWLEDQIWVVGWESDNSMTRDPVSTFCNLWNKIYGNRPGLSWENNPLVRVYEWDPREIIIQG